MLIPELSENGELPPGEHYVHLEQLEQRFGRSNAKRVALMIGLKSAIENFRLAGVKKIWVDGSFVTSKPEPNDIDGCWEYTSEVNISLLDSVFLDRSRLPMKAKYGLEFFPASIIEGATNLPFPMFFQINREAQPKGIIVVCLGE